MTLALPKPLSPWAAELAPYSEMFRLAVGPWLPKLARLTGDGAQALASEGDPDGFAGLGRRGPYHRLAVSEWAMLDFAGDEFLRRAIDGEHLFHELGRSSPAGTARLIVLFDCGPLQLGAPRLAQLAWLLVCARIAARRGADLFWGICQNPAAGLRRGADLADVKALLAARSAIAVKPEHLTGWQAELGRLGARDECHWVAGEADGAIPRDRAWSRILVADADEPGGRSVLVTAAFPAAPPPRVELRLPSPGVCRKLLREPDALEWRPPGAARAGSIAPGAQVVFSGTGSHLIARLSSGELVVFGARSERAPFELVATFATPPGEALVAAGFRGGRMHVLTLEAGRVLRHTLERRRWQKPVPIQLVGGATPVVSPDRLVPLWLARDQEPSFCFVDHAWKLFWNPGAPPFQPTPFHPTPRTVIAATWTRGRLVLVGVVGASQLALCTYDRDRPQRLDISNVPGRTSEAFIGVDRHGDPAFVALGSGDGEWETWRASEGVRAVRGLLSRRVFGAARFQNFDALLCGGYDENELVLGRDGQVFERLSFDGRVEHACVSPTGTAIAAQVDGRVVVRNRAGEVRLAWGEPRP